MQKRFSKKNHGFFKSEKNPFLFYSCQIISIFLLSFFLISLLSSALNILSPASPEKLSAMQEKILEEELDKNYEERKNIINFLPYDFSKNEIEIATESAIMIDQNTGSIIFEKNADEIIPPASMTKLVEMYVVFSECEKGKISLDDTVPLPRECWRENMPLDASLMFLDKDQKVTLKELLLGLSIASGNDASIAVANYVAGSMDAFVENMNSTVKEMGLSNTHFVESSGYSEKNKTTPRDFVQFCRNYIKRFPHALKDFHSQKMLAYPQKHNLPSWQKEEVQPIVQYNTNKLLGKVPGVDGLKTGFINESGYNLALTAERNENRFLAVMMRGPGKNTSEGNFYRVQDGKKLLEYAFSNFTLYRPEKKEGHTFNVALASSKEKSVTLVPALDESMTFPLFSLSESSSEKENEISIYADFPFCLKGNIKAGMSYGSLTYMKEGKVLRKIDLVADRNSKKKFSLSDEIAFLLFKKSLSRKVL